MSFWGNAGNWLNNNAQGVLTGVGGILGILGGVQQARNHNAAAAAAGQPQVVTTGGTRNPWDPASPYLEEALGAARGHYLDQLGHPAPHVGGGARGASQQSRAIVDAMTQQAMNSSFVPAAQQHALSLTGGANPMLAGAYNAAAGSMGGSQMFQQYLNSLAGGGHDNSGGYMQEFLGQLGLGGGGGGGQPGGSTASNGPFGGGVNTSSIQYQSAPGVSPGSALFNSNINAILTGEYLDPETNPGLQGMLDAIGSRSRDSFDAERARLDEAAAGGYGRLGSSFYQSQANDNFDAYQRALNEQTSSVLYQHHDAERSRQMEALGMLNSRDMQMASINASRAAAGASNAQAQQALELQRMGLTLEAINSLAANNRGNAGLALQGFGQEQAGQQFGVGMLGQLGEISGNQQLAALGMVPGLEQAGYYGLQAALQGQQGIDQMDSQAAASRAANQWRNYQAQQTQGWGNYQNYLNSLLAIANVGGTSSQEQTSPGQYVAPINPWLNAFAGGAAGALGARQGFAP